MIFRVTKVVVLPSRQDSLLRIAEAASAMAGRDRPGNEGLYLYQHIDTPNTFFVISRWQSLAAIEQTANHPAYQRALAAVKDLSIERITTWNQHILEEQRNHESYIKTGNEVLRLARGVIKPEFIEGLSKRYLEVLGGFVIKQPGCLSAKLCQLVETESTVFMMSFWRTMADLNRALSTPEYHQTYQDTVQRAFERPSQWNLRLLAEDPIFPAFIS